MSGFWRELLAALRRDIPARRPPRLEQSPTGDGLSSPELAAVANYNRQTGHVHVTITPDPGVHFNPLNTPIRSVTVRFQNPFRAASAEKTFGSPDARGGHPDD